MSQTEQQEQGATAAKPGVRKDWEWFWRIIAGLMLLVIVWVLWVMYQIMPRSVVTPLAYSSAPIRSTSAPQSESGPAAVAPAAPPSAPSAPSAPQSAEAKAADPAQAAAADTSSELGKGEGLRLATDISTPPAEKQGVPITQAGKPEAAAAVPSATGAAGKDRP